MKDVLPRTYEDKHEDGSKERILIVLAECERCPVFPPLKAIVLGQRYLAATSKGKIDKDEEKPDCAVREKVDFQPEDASMRGASSDAPGDALSA